MSSLKYCGHCKTYGQHWGNECPVFTTAIKPLAEIGLLDRVDVPQLKKEFEQINKLIQPGENATVAQERETGKWQYRHCPTCSCQGRKVYPSNADRQKAYRKRKGK